MEAVSRQLPGFLGKEESLEEVNGSFPKHIRGPESSRRQKGKNGASRRYCSPVTIKKIDEWRNKL